MIFYTCVNNRSHLYDAVELHSHKFKRSSTSEFPLVSSSSETPSTTESQDIKANAIKLQENPSYVPSTSNTNTLQGEYSYIRRSDLM